MADRAEQELGHFDHPDGSYSSVNVDAVDLDKYPDFAKIKFYNATIEAGDCVFIPSFWPHTVKSFGRNIAVNAWWEIYKTPIKCPENPPIAYFSSSKMKKDSDIGPKGQEKEVDTESKEQMQDIRSVFWSSREMRQDNQVEADTFVNIMTELLQHESIKDHDYEQLFSLLDTNSDGLLQPTELDMLRSEYQLKIITTKIPAFTSYFTRTEL